jgi:sugar lactone lactonase YvrE
LKAPCDGISIDDTGNIYVTDLENNAIGVTTPDGDYRILARDDERLIWPDGLGYGPDGYFYVTVSQLHRSAAFNAGEETSQTPFLVMRFRPLAPSATGR